MWQTIPKVQKGEIIAVHRAPDSGAKSSQKTVSGLQLSMAHSQGDGLVSISELQLLW